MKLLPGTIVFVSSTSANTGTHVYHPKPSDLKSAIEAVYLLNGAFGICITGHGEGAGTYVLVLFSQGQFGWTWSPDLRSVGAP